MLSDAGREIVRQLRKGVRLPVWLTFELADRNGGVDLRHKITAGFRGVGRLLDPLLRLYFSAEFTAAMDKHAKTEFPLLRDHLAETRRTPDSASVDPEGFQVASSGDRYVRRRKANRPTTTSAEEPSATGCWPEQSQQDADGGGLPGAVRPRKHRPLLGLR